MMDAFAIMVAVAVLVLVVSRRRCRFVPAAGHRSGARLGPGPRFDYLLQGFTVCNQILM